MPPINLDSIYKFIKDFGYPVAISIYLLWSNREQSKFFSEKLDDIKDILVDIATQNSYMLNSIANYRNGNVEAGDRMSEQAIYHGERVKHRKTKSKKNVPEEGDDN